MILILWDPNPNEEQFGKIHNQVNFPEFFLLSIILNYWKLAKLVEELFLVEDFLRFRYFLVPIEGYRNEKKFYLHIVSLWKSKKKKIRENTPNLEYILNFQLIKI